MYIFMSSSETRKLRKEFLNKEWLTINEEVADNKILRCANRSVVMNLGKCLDKGEHKGLTR